jgi:DNA-binding XRE family transcriptional regulator
MYLFELGHKIRRARLKARATQAALADNSGLGRTTINLLEAGAYPDLGIRKVVRLLNSIGLDLAVVPVNRGTTRDYLKMACLSANVSFRKEMLPDELAKAFLTGKIPSGFRPHIRAIFEEVPNEVVAGAIRQAAMGAREPTMVLDNARALAKLVGCRFEEPPDMKGC